MRRNKCDGCEDEERSCTHVLECVCVEEGGLSVTSVKTAIGGRDQGTPDRHHVSNFNNLIKGCTTRHESTAACHPCIQKSVHPFISKRE